MSTTRTWHTATLLPSGKVLVAGGYGNGFLSSAELYDPALGTWTATGAMSTARGWHTATLLPNGKVLVAGGFNSTSDYLASAEMYDPATGTWSATGPMGTVRRWHTATLLPNGKVLVAGGESNSAELYDPAAGTWTAAGAMSISRYGHMATLLPNGKVLVAGGGDNNGTLAASADLYDPATGTWTATGTMNIARRWHTATLLPNGKVLVAGSYNGNDDISLASAELYDPATGTWMTTGAMSTARSYHTATLLPNGKVLVAGSYNYSSGALASAELYDVGLGFNAAWQPQLATFTSPLVLGGSLALTGSRFRGISGGSGGNTQDSPADYPVVQLRNVESGQTVFLLPTSWSADSFTSAAVSGLPPGWTLVTVFVNGIPGTSGILQLTAAPTNHAPTNLALSNVTVPENQPLGTTVGTLTTTDPDAGNTFTYTLVAGAGDTDNAAFTIVGDNLLTTSSFNYEARSSYSIRLRVTDQGGLTFEKVITIHVTDVAEAAFKIIESGGDPATGFVIRWTCEAGYAYRVNYSETLAAGDWHEIGPVQVANNGEVSLTFTDPWVAGKTRRFYMVVRTPLQ